jgi:hypothetical protein
MKNQKWNRCICDRHFYTCKAGSIEGCSYAKINGFGRCTYRKSSCLDMFLCCSFHAQADALHSFISNCKDGIKWATYQLSLKEWK